jgi:DNA topoisomerase-1
MTTPGQELWPDHPRNPHVKVDGSELRFQFKGKSGKVWRLQVKDRRIARIIRACQELPGQRLFQYQDGDELREVSSADVNAYLKEITGRDITAKDFRTWAGTVLATLALQEFEAFDTQAAQKKNSRRRSSVSPRPYNTPTICRKHPPGGAECLRRGAAAAGEEGSGAGTRECSAARPRRLRCWPCWRRG